MPQSLPPRPARDQRLDIVRGLLQLFIFASHSAATFAGAWLIHGQWGLSDSSEQFLLMSGAVLGSLYARNALRHGHRSATMDFLRRTGRLYRTHLVVFALFALLALFAETVLGIGGEVAGYGFAWLFEAPAAALPAVLAMLYRPAFMDTLPIFVWCMLALPAFLWLVDRIGAAALALPLLLYLGVHAWGWDVPAPGHPDPAFNPLAWQTLFFLGALFGRRSLLTGTALRPIPLLVAGAAVIVVLALWLRLAGRGWVPGPEIDLARIMDKPSLAPARIAHALALAYLVVVLVPANARWMHSAIASAVAVIGRHSLQVFCVGIFLSWAVGTAMEAAPGAAWWLEPPMMLAGAAILWRVATVLDRGRRPAAAPDRRAGSSPLAGATRPA
ncbi:OpgC domain-containing protein [Stella sp.]|uniref:OpgC domain-containing protein n=1 Tax=Stella sp. TaxID=2912054 RepID=UPI0035B06297